LLLLSSLPFRKTGGKTIDSAHINKALAKFLVILLQEKPAKLFQHWFCPVLGQCPTLTLPPLFRTFW
jgi:hypothetical protein